MGASLKKTNSADSVALLNDCEYLSAEIGLTFTQRRKLLKRAYIILRKWNWVKAVDLRKTLVRLRETFFEAHPDGSFQVPGGHMEATTQETRSKYVGAMSGRFRYVGAYKNRHRGGE